MVHGVHSLRHGTVGIALDDEVEVAFCVCGTYQLAFGFGGDCELKVGWMK